MDHYQDAIWRHEHPYLAQLWNKLVASPRKSLCAMTSTGICLWLEQGNMASPDRLQLFWSTTQDRGTYSTSPLWVVADDLSELFEKAEANTVVSLSINERTVPLEAWKEDGD